MAKNSHAYCHCETYARNYGGNKLFTFLRRPSGALSSTPKYPWTPLWEPQHNAAPISLNLWHNNCTISHKKQTNQNELKVNRNKTKSQNDCKGKIYNKTVEEWNICNFPHSGHFTFTIPFSFFLVAVLNFTWSLPIFLCRYGYSWYC